MDIGNVAKKHGKGERDKHQDLAVWDLVV